MKKIILACLASFAVVATAAPISFDFKDPKGVNAVQFHLDSLLEPISGSDNGVSGMVSFDPAAPASTAGTILITANSLMVSNATMTEHLHGSKWLDVGSHPEITFELTSLSDAKTTNNTTSAVAQGKFKLKGVTQEIAVPVRITYLADALGKRTKPGNKGDLLVIRGEFTVQRADFGIQSGQNEDKVSPEITLKVAIVGSAPKA